MKFVHLLLWFIIGFVCAFVCLWLVFGLKGMTTMGMYVPQVQWAIADTTLSPETFCYVMWHEYAHGLWDTMTDAQRAEWSRISQSTPRLTKYANTSIEEDWAETYAMTRYCGHEISRIKDHEVRYTFMRSLS